MIAFLLNDLRNLAACHRRQIYRVMPCLFALGMVVALPACALQQVTPEPTFQPMIVFYAATVVRLPTSPPATSTSMPASAIAARIADAAAEPTQTAVISSTVASLGATVTPSAAEKPAATAGPMLRPRPNATPTAAPTAISAPGVVYAAPRVTMPLEGEFRHAKSPPLVAWDAPALIQSNDYYAVNIHHNQGWNVACLKNRQGLAPDWLPNELPHHGFGVFVVVLRVATPVAEGGYCAGIEVSPPSKQVNFYWAFE